MFTESNTQVRYQIWDVFKKWSKQFLNNNNKNDDDQKKKKKK